MPVSNTYTCEQCGKSLNDSDLEADATLRRIVVTQALEQKWDAASSTIVNAYASNGMIVFCSQQDVGAYMAAHLT